MAPVIAQAEFVYAVAALAGTRDWAFEHPGRRFSGTGCWVLHVLVCMNAGGVQEGKRDEFLSQAAAMGVCRTPHSGADFTFEGVFRGKA